MRVLVTGAGGFVGRHLSRELHAHGHAVVACDQRFLASIPEASETKIADLRNAQALKKVVAETAPEACVHLGGVAFVPKGTDHPELVLEINILGTVNILEALKGGAPGCRTLTVSTAQIYARAGTDHFVAESDPIAPVGIYAVSKAAADLTTLGYAKAFGMHTMTVRPNNHTGPGQSPEFVVASFVRQIKSIATGESKPVISVGNLDCERSFTDVRDVVRAYRLIIEKGHAGEAYNISSPEQIRIGDLLNTLCRLAAVTPEMHVDPSKVRPTDRSPDLDVRKIRRHTGWEAEIDLEHTLHDMLGITR